MIQKKKKKKMILSGWLRRHHVFRLASDTTSYLHSANKSLSNGKSIFSFHADEEDTMKIMPYCVDTAYDLATVNVCFRVSNLRGRDLPIAPATLS
jgi:hypothetical protein